MKRLVLVLLAVVLSVTVFCVPASAKAQTRSLDEIFDAQLGSLDYFHELTPSYMAFRVSRDLYELYLPEDFNEEANEYHYPISAEVYENYLFTLFEVSDATLNAVRLESGYNEAENTYDLYYIGGFGGALPEREYQGFKNNGDGTYSVFYATINYLYLPDSEYENAEKLDWPYEYEYDGKIYENGPDGYTHIDGYLKSGRVYTVSYNETTGIVRIIAQNNYTEADLPESFDYAEVPAVIRYEMRHDLGVSFDISEEAGLGGTTIRAYKTNEIDAWIEERASDYCTYSITARDNWYDVNPKEPITITFELPEEYERPSVYWYTYYAGDILEATIDRENGTISVEAFEFGNFVVYDRSLLKLNNVFESQTSLLDMYFNIDVSFMEYKLSFDLCDLYKSWDEDYWAPAIVPAADLEKHLYSLFEVSDWQLEELRERLGYNEAEQTYLVDNIGGWGGLMPEREYQGYKNNGDGTYSIYYGKINYLHLPESEYETIELLGWPFEYEYNGKIYESGPDGYYCIDSIEKSGKVYTVSYDVKTGTVRFISEDYYGESDLPEQFDNEQVPYYVNYRMRYDLGVSFEFEEDTFDFNSTVTVNKYNGMDQFGGYPDGLPTTAEDFLLYTVDFSVYPQKEYTVIFDIPEGYEVPAIYAVNEYGKFEEIESTVDKENGKISVKTSYCGEFILYDNYRPDYLLGDVNDDGMIDKYDYVLAKRAILRTYTLNKDQNFAADIDKNQVIDTFDYIYVKRHVMGTYKIPYEYVCNHNYESTVTAPTESEMGYTTHTCTKCDDSYVDAYVRTENGYSYGLEYVLDDYEKTCTITGIGACGDSELVIPSEIEGFAVTRIAYNAFYECEQLISVTLPDSIAYIDGWAFSNCYNLESINIPEGVFAIEYATFYNCRKLKSITLPDGIAYIDANAFCYCYGLESVNIPEGVAYIGDWAFEDCFMLTSIEIPNSVGSIGYNAFYGCYNLNYAEYDNVNYLGNSTNPYLALIEVSDRSMASYEIHPDTKLICSEAFAHCPLKEIEIPYGVTRIESQAFLDCTHLISIVIPDSVTYIGSSAFEYCYSLTSVTLPSGIFEISWGMFYECHSLETITVPEGVEAIGGNAFFNCRNLSTVILPKSIAFIDDGAFNECYQLSIYYAGSENDWNQIYIYDRNIFYIYGIPIHFNSNGPCNHELGDWCFDNAFHWMECSLCNEQVYFESHIYNEEIVHPTETEAGYRVYTCDLCGYSYVGPYIVYSEGFDYTVNEDGKTCTITGIGKCEDNDLVIPPEIDGYTVTTIDFGAFYGCTQLATVTLPDTVTLICSSAFKNCEKMSAINLGGVTSIGSNAFENCGNLTHVTLSDGTQSLAAKAFMNCHSLTSISIPVSLTDILASTFEGCYRLFDVYYAGSEEEWNQIYLEEDGNQNLTYANIHFNLSGPCKEHTYSTTVRQPTDVNYGYTEYRCEICGKYYIGSYVAPTTGDFSKGLSYKVNDNGTTCTIVGIGTCEDTNLVISPVIDGYLVTTIGNSAFEYCDHITSVTIPNDISIKDSAFRHCSNLKSVEFSDRVTSLGDYMFLGCTSLTSIRLPNNIREIAWGMFDSCTALTSIVIPDGVTNIDFSAFYNCTNLKSITIPDSLTEIGPFAVAGCSSLTDIYYAGTEEMWANIYVYNEGNFSVSNSTVHFNYSNGCSHNYIATVTQPTDVDYGYTIHTCENCGNSYEDSYIEPTGVFSKGLQYEYADIENVIAISGMGTCEDTVLVFSPVIDGYKVISINAWAFEGCVDITSVTIPNTVSYIEYGTFSDCTGLTSITVPNSITRIYYNAFQNCNNLTDIYYAGSEEDWAKIVIEDNNEALLNATIHFNSK